jgi:hypothetical protein
LPKSNSPLNHLLRSIQRFQESEMDRKGCEALTANLTDLFLVSATAPIRELWNRWLELQFGKRQLLLGAYGSR